MKQISIEIDLAVQIDLRVAVLTVQSWNGHNPASVLRLAEFFPS